MSAERSEQEAPGQSVPVPPAVNFPCGHPRTAENFVRRKKHAVCRECDRLFSLRRKRLLRGHGEDERGKRGREPRAPLQRGETTPRASMSGRNAVIVEMHDNGATYKAIGERFGISRQCAQQIVKREKGRQ